MNKLSLILSIIILLSSQVISKDNNINTNTIVLIDPNRTKYIYELENDEEEFTVVNETNLNLKFYSCYGVSITKLSEKIHKLILPKLNTFSFISCLVDYLDKNNNKPISWFMLNFKIKLPTS